MSCNNIPEHPLKLNAGDDNTIKMRYRNKDGTPYDIAGYVIVLECEEPALTKQAVITRSTEGEFEFRYSKANTLNINKKNMGYEVVFYPSGLSGTKNTVFDGTIHLRPEKVA